MSFCSPGADNKVFCYSFDSLKKIALAWNYLNPNETIDLNTNNTSNKLYNSIKTKLDKYLITYDKNHWAWLDIIKILNKNKNKNPKISKVMKEIETKELKPSQPIEWIHNKTEWLSNFDIENVLIQYHNDPSFNYHFHGVFTIDFFEKSSSGTCKYYSNCNIIIKDIIKNKKKYFGFITNLCKNDEPGTHWTSSFFVLDPSIPSYGAYYYDSGKKQIPSHLKPVFINIQNQMKDIYPNKKFNIHVNNVLHQKGNTECGIFSIVFQTRWLILLKKKINPSFTDIIHFIKMNDSVMKNLRNKLFRPNIKTILYNK
jgi:hypothetical protein